MVGDLVEFALLGVDAAEATTRSTGAAFITVSVISVLLIPMNRPETTTHAASTALISVPSAITTRVAVIASRLTKSVGTVPNRR